MQRMTIRRAFVKKLLSMLKSYSPTRRPSTYVNDPQRACNDLRTYLTYVNVLAKYPKLQHMSASIRPCDRLIRRNVKS